ncbi:MAG TPA: hypothetical protein P5050_10305 [Bacteroidia bacterium]|nr:hypothetical protein [Bacteroidia bacterium]HRS59601.1 hypothetical protein [Bacteroidia bacterium]HRU68870.1 hypothetical protein [Bacteroidia bacterium]
MRKVLIMILFCGLIAQVSYSQKYIKYVFLDNKVKITIPFQLEKKDVKDFQDREVLKLLKVWQTKKAETTLWAFLVDTKPANASCDLIKSYLDQISVFTENKSVRSSKTQLINNRQEVCVMEISESGENTSGQFMSIFGGKINDNQTIIFVFQCPEQKKKHYQPVVNGIIKSLTLN